MDILKKTYNVTYTINNSKDSKARLYTKLLKNKLNNDIKLLNKKMLIISILSFALNIGFSLVLLINK